MTPSERYDSLFQTWAAWDRRRDGTWVPRQPELDWALLKAQAVAESGLDPDAVSPVGAKGLTQFMKGVPDEITLSYIGAFVDGEGTISLHKQKYTKADGSLGFHYQPIVMACNTKVEPLRFIERTLGVGRVGLHTKETDTQKASYTWRASAREAIDAVGLFAPYLIIKRPHAIILLFEAAQFIRERRRPRWIDGRFTSRTDEEIAELERIRSSFRELNAKGPPIHSLLEEGEEDEASAIGAGDPLLTDPPASDWPDLRLRRIAPRYWKTWDEWQTSEFGEEFPLNRYINPFDPEDAIRAQADIMAWLLGVWKGNVRQALSSYNWGIGHMRATVEKYGDQWETHLPLETRQYLKRILHG